MSDRRRLPDRRACESISFERAGKAYTATVARFCDEKFRKADALSCYLDAEFGNVGKEAHQDDGTISFRRQPGAE
jgi:hypothetical protein